MEPTIITIEGDKYCLMKHACTIYDTTKYILQKLESEGHIKIKKITERKHYVNISDLERLLGG
jgi:hypothetical protein